MSEVVYVPLSEEMITDMLTGEFNVGTVLNEWLASPRTRHEPRMITERRAVDLSGRTVESITLHYAGPETYRDSNEYDTVIITFGDGSHIVLEPSGRNVEEPEYITVTSDLDLIE